MRFVPEGRVVSISENPDPTVRSAEGVELHMPVAGPTPRMLAYAIDAVALWCGLVLLFVLAVLVLPGLAAWARELVPSPSSQDARANPERWLLPFILFMMLATYFGELLYFLFWETVSGGSSPGKWLVGLRVVRLDGLRLELRASFIRNLMRAADVLPSSYVVGLTRMLLSPRGQRLGDLAAGTLVVRLDRPEPIAKLRFRPGLLPLALSRVQLARLGERERTLTRGSLRRASKLSGERRAGVLRLAADALCSTLQLDPREAAVDPELFLRRLWLTMQQGRR
jgi:uncharacterized RDD family membrane protein YckC